MRKFRRIVVEEERENVGRERNSIYLNQKCSNEQTKKKTLKTKRERKTAGGGKMTTTKRPSKSFQIFCQTFVKMSFLWCLKISLNKFY